ncbi:HIT family protein [Limnobacter litoralis]|uniref:HIT domain-containing protein n=1 Tax=Limnobacter litoralis TaxID=481366 RepID=A0ABQ5YRV3_9BURK|nr:HIT family protein [Limnobacter litoralis]GLR26849.1 hypothetical protein GCM10007875_19390 [Limnobacter litoralis]
MSQAHSLVQDCPLCQSAGGKLVFEHSKFRVIWADEPLYPGFLRLVWQSHVREFSDLSDEDQLLCMRVVVLLERFVLQEMKADKVNLATLGNVVAHLHWHVIPRFTDDAHFPAPVWANARPDAALAVRQQAVLNRKTHLIEHLALHMKGRFS